MTKRYPNCACYVCEKRIYRYPKLQKKGRVYCSRECTYKGQRLNLSAYVPPPKKQSVAPRNVSPLKIALANLRGGVCEKCKHANFAILNAHHIVEVCNGGTDDLDNLLLLCPNCHALEHLNDPSSVSSEEFLVTND